MKKLLFILFTSILLSMGVWAKTYNYDLIPPESVEYTLPEYQDSLKCSMFIEENGILDITIKSVTSTGDFPEKITVTLLQNGNEISSVTTKKEGFDENKYHLTEGLSQGEYILKITNDTKFSDVTFNIETNFTPWENVEGQAGDGKENATELTFSQKYLGGVTMSDKSDIYRFTMEKDGYIVIDMYSSELKHFTLSDEFGNEIGTMQIKLSDPKTVFETRCGLKKGNYYISISPEEDFLSPLYSLEIFDYYDMDFESEYNNLSSTATPLPENTEVRGNLFGYNDIDFYTFSINSSSNVKVTLTDKYLNNDGHYSFTLYDSQVNEIISRSNTSTVSFEQVLDKGVYYLSVSCQNENYFTPFGYSLKLKTTATTHTDENQIEDGVQNEGNTSSDGMESEQAPDQSTDISQFDDVHADSWYAKDIFDARSMGLIEGTDGNNFNPSGNITIAEAVTMASRLYSLKYNVQIPLLPTEEALWYSHYVAFAYAANIISPSDFDNFDKTATREEMAHIFAGVFKNIEIPAITVSIPDVQDDNKYKGSIHTLYALEILYGNDDNGTFYPKNNITRAESAVILLRGATLLGI